MNYCWVHNPSSSLILSYYSASTLCNSWPRQCDPLSTAFPENHQKLNKTLMAQLINKGTRINNKRNTSLIIYHHLYNFMREMWSKRRAESSHFLPSFFFNISTHHFLFILLVNVCSIHGWDMYLNLMLINQIIGKITTLHQILVDVVVVGRD